MQRHCKTEVCYIGWRRKLLVF